MDFSEADCFDPAWNRKLTFMFKALTSENNREISSARYQHHATLLQAPWLNEDEVKGIQEEAMKDLNNIMAYYRPWEYNQENIDEEEQKESVQLRNSWQSAFGSLDDPEVQAKLAKVRAALLKRAADNKPPDSPLSGQGVFNRETANNIGALQSMNRKSNGTTTGISPVT